MKIKKIKLLENPKKGLSMNDCDMALLIGGSNYNCPGTYTDGGFFGDDKCAASYSSTGSCGDANDYCGSYASCTFKLNS